MSVQDHEHLAHYLTNEGWFNNHFVKGDAFRPLWQDKEWRTSVTRHDGKNDAEMKRRVEVYKKIKRKNPITVHGWANVLAGAVRTISVIPSLDVKPAPSVSDPHHAHIVGWHLDEGQRMIQAEEIARLAGPPNLLS